jgi:hypothetical protein
VAFELKGRDVVLGLGEQVHGHEPARQRQLGGLENRAADDAALVPANGALPVAAPGAQEHRVPARFTVRAGKTLRPACRNQRRLALVFGAVSVQELGHRKSGLKLNSIHRHGVPPVSVRPLLPSHWLTT